MRFKDASVTQVLVGLRRVGIVGLRDALQKADAAGATDRDAVVTSMLEALGPRNYIPEQQAEAYRIALWREYLRHKGRSFSEFYSEIPVTVTGMPGEARARFVAVVESVLARLELRPVVTFVEQPAGAPHAELVIQGETVARGSQDAKRIETAIRRSVSHW